MATAIPNQRRRRGIHPEQLLERFDTLQQVRARVRQFAMTTNEHRLLERHGYRSAEGRPSDDINRLVNFVIINSVDNKILGGAAPSEYRAKMPPDRVSAILSRALCPEALFSDDYNLFVAARAQMLTEFGRQLAQAPKA
jgi:hypothetical protein